MRNDNRETTRFRCIGWTPHRVNTLLGFTTIIIWFVDKGTRGAAGRVSSKRCAKRTSTR